MKILFLDIDGVLNNEATLSAGTSCWMIDDKCLLLLKEIVDKTGCQIVLSSTWRCYEKGKSSLKQHFRKHGIPLWVSQTKDLNDRSGGWSYSGYIERKEEISLWILDNAANDARIAILDDDPEAGLNKECFFRTSFQTGLTREIADKVIDFLGE